MSLLMDRAYIMHARCLFNKVDLDEARTSMDNMRTQPEFFDNLSTREADAVMRGESSDKLRLQKVWYKIWGDLERKDAILEMVMPFYYVTYPVQIRHVKSISHNVPWHQDIAYMRLHGDKGHQQIITCFIPLEPVPSNHTTIQFALDDDFQTQKLLNHQPVEGFGAGIANNNFSNCKHFDLQLGDALIFGDHAIHRTYTPPLCQIERRSLEFRLVKKEHLIKGKDYFDLNMGDFINVN